MRAFSHSGRPCAPGIPLACCRKGRYSVGVPSGGGATGLSSQRWRTSKVFVPSSSTFRLICLRATALLSPSHFAPYGIYGIARWDGRAVSAIAGESRSHAARLLPRASNPRRFAAGPRACRVPLQDSWSCRLDRVQRREFLAAEESQPLRLVAARQPLETSNLHVGAKRSTARRSRPVSGRSWTGQRTTP